MRRGLLLPVVALLAVSAAGVSEPRLPTFRVGSKSFTESYVLAEIAAQIIDETGEAKAVRDFGLGQTGIVFEALAQNEIDLCPEYTGTIAETLLKRRGLRDAAAIRFALERRGLTVSRSLGFSNTYAVAVSQGVHERLGLETLSELAPHHELRASFSHEFLKRQDGYPRLQRVYGLGFSEVEGLSHGLAYEAIKNGAADLTDVYSTDPKIERFHLHPLVDDRHAFPEYDAVWLARADVARRFPKTWARLRALAGQISESDMRRLNAEAEIQGKSFGEIASRFLGHPSPARGTGLARRLWRLTLEHISLVGISLAASIAVGVPLAIAATRSAPLAQIVLIGSELVQTIPSLALLCFLIPFFGIGKWPALVALFLYGLLPIVRTSYVGLTSIDPKLREAARAMNLVGWQRLRWLELPLASPSILAGIKTSAVINVGTATLAALIGAGGYGEPIVTGLALNDTHIILEGALPAAVMALAVHGFFEGIDAALIPRGLRRKSN